MNSVFSCYNMPQGDKTESQNDVDGFMSEFQESINYESLDNNQGGSGVDDNSVNMKSILKRAEQRIIDLEKRLPVKFEEVNFLNYQKKKRILVS